MALNLGDTTTYIEALIDSGADALSNLFYIEFKSLRGNEGYVDGNMSMALTVRAIEVTLPSAATHSDKERHFITTSASFPVSEISLEKTFSIKFRVDSHYDVYRYLLRQQAVTGIPNLAYAASALSEEKEAREVVGDAKNFGFTVSFYSMPSAVTQTDQLTPITSPNSGFKPSNYYTLLYQFGHCWIEKLSPLEFGWDKADSQTVQATFRFMDYLDPQNLLLTKAARGINY